MEYQDDDFYERLKMGLVASNSGRTLTIETKDGRAVQRLRLSPTAPEMSFLMGKAPLLWTRASL